jgi:hypothetical protein
MVDKKDLKSFELKARVGSSPTSGTLEKWGISLVGRALDLHSKGQEFDSLILHIRRCGGMNNFDFE